MAVAIKQLLEAVRNEALPELRSLRERSVMQGNLIGTLKDRDAMHRGVIAKQRDDAEAARLNMDKHCARILQDLNSARLELARVNNLKDTPGQYYRSEAWLAVCEALPERAEYLGNDQQQVMAAIRELQRKAKRFDAMWAAGHQL